MTVEWKVLIGSFDYPTLLTLRQRYRLHSVGAARPANTDPRAHLSPVKTSMLLSLSV